MPFVWNRNLVSIVQLAEVGSDVVYNVPCPLLHLPNIENVSKDVIHVSSTILGKTLWAVLVVDPALFLVLKNLICTLNLLEFLSGFRIITVFIGVKFSRFLAVRTPDLGVRSIRFYPQDIIESCINDHLIDQESTFWCKQGNISRLFFFVYNQQNSFPVCNGMDIPILQKMTLTT